MGNVLVSFAIRNGIVAVLISEDGTLKFSHVETIKDSSARESVYLGIIYAFDLALRIVRQYTQDNRNSREITFETSNSTFVKWIENQYSKEPYQDKFMDSLIMLQSLPIMYRFSYTQRTKAWAYAVASNCKGEKITSLI